MANFYFIVARINKSCLKNDLAVIVKPKGNLQWNILKVSPEILAKVFSQDQIFNSWYQWLNPFMTEAVII